MLFTPGVGLSALSSTPVPANSRPGEGFGSVLAEPVPPRYVGPVDDGLCGGGSARLDDLLFLQVESPLQGGEGLVVDFAPVPHADGFGAFQA
jgi:hypothetical protein